MEEREAGRERERDGLTDAQTDGRIDTDREGSSAAQIDREKKRQGGRS